MVCVGLAAQRMGEGVDWWLYGDDVDVRYVYVVMMLMMFGLRTVRMPAKPGYCRICDACDPSHQNNIMRPKGDDVMRLQEAAQGCVRAKWAGGREAVLRCVCARARALIQWCIGH